MKYFADYRNLLKENLDVVFVCVTHDIAPEITIKSLQSNRHVFCEKPPGRNPGDVSAVIDEEHLHPELKLKYGFNHRYHNSIIDALKIIKSGDLGDVINVRGLYGKATIAGRNNNWRSQRSLAGGGILLDQGIHMLDLMRLICGEFTTVKSFVTNSHWQHDVEDNAFAIMKTDSGVVAMIHSTATQWKHKFQIDITLTRGSITLSGILTGTKSYGQETMTVIKSSPDDLGVPNEIVSTYINDNSWEREIKDFAEAILENKDVLTGNSKDALATMDLVYKIYRADDDWASKYNI